MLESAEFNNAANTAASFSLMLLRAYHSRQVNPVVTALKAGLIENRTDGAADQLIAELTDGASKLTESPAELAARNPGVCVKLGEIFAQALVTGAEAYEMALLQPIIAGRQSHEVSRTFALLEAPALSTLFRPFQRTMNLN